MKMILQFLQFLAGLAFTSLISAAAQPAATDSPLLIDLTAAPSWEQFSATGIQAREMKGSHPGKLYLIQPVHVALKFPGDVTLQCHAGVAGAHFIKNYLRYLEVQSERMPLKEALALGRLLHEALGLPLNPLEKWAVEEGSKEPWRAKNFVFHAAGSGMELQAEVKRGGGDTFPWIIRLVLTMPAANDKPSSTSPLFTKPGLISLDPPSGTRYTAEEDLRLFRENRGIPGAIPPVRKETPASTSISTEKTKPAAHSNQSGDRGDFLWLWIGGAFAVTAVAYWLVKRRA